MKRKKIRSQIILLLAVLLPTFVHTAPNSITPNFDNINKQLTALNLPIPGSGVKIVPLEAMVEPSIVTKKLLLEKAEQDKNGFAAGYESRAKELLEYEKIAISQYRRFFNHINPWETHLRHDLSELKFSFNFKPVPESEVVTVIGFAPAGSYKEGLWSGGGEYFKTSFASCSYMQLHPQFMAVELVKEFVKKTVNGKNSMVFVKGSDESGYLYKVHWYGNTDIHELECATEKFHANNVKKTIELAKTIDANY